MSDDFWVKGHGHSDLVSTVGFTDNKCLQTSSCDSLWRGRILGFKVQSINGYVSGQISFPGTNVQFIPHFLTNLFCNFILFPNKCLFLQTMATQLLHLCCHLIFLLNLNEAFKNKNHDNRWAYDLELRSKVKCHCHKNFQLLTVNGLSSDFF